MDKQSARNLFTLVNWVLGWCCATAVVCLWLDSLTPALAFAALAMIGMGGCRPLALLFWWGYSGYVEQLEQSMITNEGDDEPPAEDD